MRGQRAVVSVGRRMVDCRDDEIADMREVAAAKALNPESVLLGISAELAGLSGSDSGWWEMAQSRTKSECFRGRRGGKVGGGDVLAGEDYDWR